MKTTAITSRIALITGLLAMAGVATAAGRVEHRDAWSQEFAVSSGTPTLQVRNIWGSVRIRPGPEGLVRLDIQEHRSAPDQELFERSLEFYGLEIESDGQGVAVSVGDYGQSWRGRNPCRRCRVEYQFEISVPPGTKVYASTVNDGSVEIHNIDGRVSADNVNGPVEIVNASACESVESVNGDVSLSFTRAPASDCDIETINGDISLLVPANSGLDFSVDLGNGRMKSELPIAAVAIPARVEHVESGGSQKYKIHQSAGLRLAGGGPLFSVKSLNGDLRIQKTE